MKVKECSLVQVVRMFFTVLYFPRNGDLEMDNFNVGVSPMMVVTVKTAVTETTKTTVCETIRGFLLF